MPSWIQGVLASNITWSIAAVVVAYVFALVGLPVYTWLERRGAGLIQLRPGPNRRGPYGLVQPIADAVKLAVKEDVVPVGANPLIHAAAPMIGMIVALSTFAVIPWSGDFEMFGTSHRIQVADLNFGILFIAAISSLGVYGAALAGWSSNNKYSLLGGLRAGAQTVSYEISMGLALVGIVLVYGSVEIHRMVLAQGGAVWHWGVCQAPIAFLVFFVASYAETNRVPFDLTEAESEIVAGFFTEYSSFRFALFYMGEYVHMAITSVLTAVLFFGGWQIPWAAELFGPDPYARLFPWWMTAVALLSLALAWDTTRPKRMVHTRGNRIFAAMLGAAAVVALALAAVYGYYASTPWIASLAGVATQIAVLAVKFLFFFWMFIWIRWTVPRFRYDQLMRLGWKVLLPLALFNLGATGALVLAGVL